LTGNKVGLESDHPKVSIQVIDQTTCDGVLIAADRSLDRDHVGGGERMTAKHVFHWTTTPIIGNEKHVYSQERRPGFEPKRSRRKQPKR
jgi:hypothetical protein